MGGLLLRLPSRHLRSLLDDGIDSTGPERPDGDINMTSSFIWQADRSGHAMPGLVR